MSDSSLALSPLPAGLSLREPLLVHGTVEAWARAAESRPGPHPEDEARLRSLHGAGTRRRFVASRLLLRVLLGTLVGGRPEGVRLSRTVWGRPYAPDLPGLDFSLSHTGSFLVAAVVRDGRIGVDAERSGRVMSVLEHRICTPYERAAFATRVLSGAGRDRELLRLWTLKEAYTKALGTGLRQAPRSFGLDDDDPVGRPVLRDSDGTALTGGLTTVTHTMPWGPGAGVLVSVVAGHRSSPTPGPSREPVRFEPVSSR